jgi:hypothetical protein
MTVMLHGFIRAILSLFLLSAGRQSPEIFVPPDGALLVGVRAFHRATQHKTDCQYLPPERLLGSQRDAIRCCSVSLFRAHGVVLATSPNPPATDSLVAIRKRSQRWHQAVYHDMLILTEFDDLWYALPAASCRVKRVSALINNHGNDPAALYVNTG